MITIKARDLGHEHLGKYVVVPEAGGRAWQMYGVMHQAHITGPATLDDPHPPVDPSRGTFVIVYFSGLSPHALSPDDDVEVVD